MKALSLSHIAIPLLLLSASVNIYGCNSSAKPAVQTNTGNKYLKDLDKTAFLNMVDSVGHLLGKKQSSVEDVNALVETYRSKYKFTLSSGVLAGNETGDVIVNVSKRSDMLVMFGLSSKFQKQISFYDLKRQFGAWKVGVLPREPVVIPVLFAIKGRDSKVQIMVASSKLPTQKSNVIKYITVSK